MRAPVRMNDSRSPFNHIALRMNNPASPPAAANARWHGVDFHVLMTLLFRSWSILAGAATVLIVPIWLTPVEQGYYYTFASILALHIFFELGLSQVVVQLVGHEVAHLRMTDQRLHGERFRIDRLASLVQLLRRWYCVAALLFAVMGGAAGAVFFFQQGQLPPLDWAFVWIALTLCTAINLAYMPALALFEGTGQVGQVARLRLIQSAVGYAGVWAIFFCGGRLWAAVAVPLVSGIMTTYWLRRQGALYQWLKQEPFAEHHRIDWRREVLPFQWRIAVSWISGYFIFYAFTPLIFAHQGAAEAGRFGMAMTIFNSVSAVGMSWINAKAPQFGMHISRGERTALNALFLAVLKRSLAFTASASIAVVATALVLDHADLRFMDRISDPAVIASLGIVCLLNCIIFSVATYMRAHREEPMLAVSVTTGIGTALIAYFGSIQSVTAMSAGYVLFIALVALPWSLNLFMRYFKRPQ